MKNFADVKNSCMFAMSTPKTSNITEIQVVFFCTILNANICKDIRLSVPYGITTGFSCSLSLARRERAAFLIYSNSNFIPFMPKTNDLLNDRAKPVLSSTTNARKASTSKTEKLLKQLSDKVLSLQRDNEEKDRRIDYLNYYIAKSTPTMFSCFEEKHPIDSQDWKKLYKMQCQLNNI